MTLPLRFPARALARAALALALTAALALPLAIVAPSIAQDEAGSAKTEPLGIVSGSGRHRFSVEVMRTDADRARGLMYRRTMAPDRGMLFDFERDQPVTMWMKNTYLPLDIVFIRRDGTIARIAPDTEPLSMKIIPSGEPVLAVLELNAGTSAKLGIKAGDRVEHGLFKTR